MNTHDGVSDGIASAVPDVLDRAGFQGDFMGWAMPCWTNYRGVEAMDNSLALMDLTVYGRQEPWEDSPLGWPLQWGTDDPHHLRMRTNGRPVGAT